MDSKRNTIQRNLIFDAVKEIDTHATAEQVYEYVAGKHPTVSKATVYRNLNQMSESGELLNIGIFYGSARYDYNCHEHYHFACEDCKKVFDVEGDFSDLVNKTQSDDGFDVAGYRLHFYGLCHDCKDN